MQVGQAAWEAQIHMPVTRERSAGQQENISHFAKIKTTFIIVIKEGNYPLQWYIFPLFDEV